MSCALQDEPSVTVAEFDAFLDAQVDERAWEVVGGRILGMTSPNLDHAQVVSNIGFELKRAAGARGCQAFFGNVSVQRAGDRQGSDEPQPDLLVRCGERPAGRFVTDPLIVAEVLSASTMDLDRGPKLAFYKQPSTLLNVVLVYQDEMRIELCRRAASGWTAETLTAPDASLTLEVIGASMMLADVYAGVFAPDGQPRNPVATT